METYFSAVCRHIDRLLTETAEQKYKVNELMEMSGEVVKEADEILLEIRELKRLLSQTSSHLPEKTAHNSRNTELIKARITKVSNRLTRISKLSAITANEMCSLDSKALELEELPYVEVRSRLKLLFPEERQFTFKNANYILPSVAMENRERKWLDPLQQP